MRYTQHITLPPVALANAALDRIRRLEALYGSRCPACGSTLPDDTERFELAQGRYYCPRCGYEWGGADDA